MSWRSVYFGKEAVFLTAAFLLWASQVQAGDRAHPGDAYRGSSRNGASSYLPAKPATGSVTFAAALPPTVSLVLTMPAQAEPEPLAVNLRGPSGQVRRFAVEGGSDAIQIRQVVLRAGESITFRLLAAK
jgi:hypothetical protein